MAYFLDDMAAEDRNGYSDTRTLSDGEMSDIVPFQGRTSTTNKVPIISESSSESDDPGRERTDHQQGKKRRRQSKSKHTGNENAFLVEMKKNNDILTTLVKKMKRHDKRLESIENQLEKCTQSSSSSPATPRRPSLRKDVPCEVRRETRRVYSLLLEDEESHFDGWKIEPGVTFKDPHNQHVVNTLIQEVKALNPSFLTQHIRDAAYRFYRSRNEDHSAKRRGKFDEKTRAKRRHERLVRKLQERSKMAESAKYKDSDEKELWKKIVTVDFMSSEESGVEEGQEILVSKPLLWQSEEVTSFKLALDHAALGGKTPLARRQMKRRRTGSPSTRPRPTGDFPAWAFNEQ